MKTFIVAGDHIIDGHGSFSESEKLLARAHKSGLRITILEIVDLAKRWEDNLNPHEFKSGASAMAAIEKGRKILSSKKADLIVIKGSDFLKTGYEKGARENFMKLYLKKFTPLDGYDRLVPLFLRYHKVSEDDYFKIRDALFNNYAKTWKGPLPDKRWFEPLTKYFRGVDCANPNVDYQGQIILSGKVIANSLKVPEKSRIQILGNAFTKLSVDGLESLPKVASYLHLSRTIRKALTEAKIDYKSEFLNGRAILDAYSCYPVVPMALIYRLGLVNKITEIPNFLKHHEVTVTGGLNLGRAAWNLTSLNSLIVMRKKLMASRTIRFGLVHGNGSLGNQQGITVLTTCK